jgi:S-methylmethionine-dependent homocysteine/selenocysteine methylase
VNLPGPIALLDGSMGQELINRGAGGDGLLWAADALFNAPQTVLQIHRDYIAAGADIITTNSYSAIRWKLEQAGAGHRLEEMNRLAGELAVQARNESAADSGREILIAGSLPPQHGSYNPDRVLPYRELEPLYRQQAAWLAPYVDFFLCETMSTAEEGRAAATGAAATGKPVWVSWTLDDERAGCLRSGESIAGAVRALEDLPVSMRLGNCSRPETLSAALPELLRHGPAGAYGNGFSDVSSEWVYSGNETLPGVRQDLGPEAYASFAAQWIEAGARVIGGCCEIGPAHINRLRTLIDSRL